MGGSQPPKVPVRYKALAIALFILSFLTYAFYLDILVPGLPYDSYRLAIGDILFLIPSFLLAGGQLTIGGLMVDSTLPTVSRGAFRLRMWHAMVIGGWLTFLFSLTYTAYPMRGPVYYATFVGNKPEAILFEALWALSTIVSAGWGLRKLSGARWKHALFTAGVALMFIVVAAS